MQRSGQEGTRGAFWVGDEYEQERVHEHEHERQHENERAACPFWAEAQSISRVAQQRRQQSRGCSVAAALHVDFPTPVGVPRRCRGRDGDVIGGG
jgi:hypothetical protein